MLDPQSLLRPQPYARSGWRFGEATSERTEQLKRSVFSLELVGLIVAKGSRKKTGRKMVARSESHDSTVDAPDHILEKRRRDGEDYSNVPAVSRVANAILLVRPEQNGRAGIDDNRPSQSFHDEDSAAGQTELRNTVEHCRSESGAWRAANDVEDPYKRAVNEQRRCLLLGHRRGLAQLVDVDVPGADVVELEDAGRDERVLQDELARLVLAHVLEQRV